MPAPIQISTDGRAFTIVGATTEGSHCLAEPALAEEERQMSYPLDPNAAIAAAFRAAGLPCPEAPKVPLSTTARVAPGPIIAAALKAARLTQS